MLNSLTRLFRLYRDRHYTIYAGPMLLATPQGRQIGYVDQICYSAQGVHLAGWSVLSKLSLRSGGFRAEGAPSLQRADVATALQLGEEARPGFDLSLEQLSGGETILSLGADDAQYCYLLPKAGRRARVIAALHIRAAFVLAVWRARREIVGTLRRPETETRQALKRAMDLTPSVQEHVFDAAVFGTKEPSASSEETPQDAEVPTLIMPVYDAFEFLQQSLGRIVEHTTGAWRMVLINDASPDPRVRPFLQTWRDTQCARGIDVELLENKVNLGFIGTVNRAFDHARDHKGPAVLVNSDALVPKGWLQRLLAPLDRGSDVASVTPLSNNAEILSVPLPCAVQELKEGAVDQIDATLARAVRGNSDEMIPTGVGFCMAMRREFLRQVPQFDTVFGRGYGEEVDWCQRVAALGGRHLCAANLFVEHAGGKSFGSMEKQQAIARNNALISQRHPEFDASVQSFLHRDPLRSARFIAALAMIRQMSGEVPVFVGHSMGGGAEDYLARRVSGLTRAGQSAVVLRLGGSLRFGLELHTPLGLLETRTDEVDSLLQILSILRGAHIVYSCAVGDRDPKAIPSVLLSILEQVQGRLTLLVHDYFLLSPSYCLLDAKGRYLPRPLTRNAQVDDVKRDAEWQRAWRSLVAQADRIICFSHASKEVVTAVYPEAQDKIMVTPHRDLPTLAPVVTDASGPMVLGVLGHIGQQKGAQVVRDLSFALAGSGIDRLVVVGKLDRAFRLAPDAIVTGSYSREDISRLAQSFGVSCWLVPSIWPETFSYTMHEALSTGLPCFCFDLGGQAEVTERAANGHVLPLALSAEPALLISTIEEIVRDEQNHRCTHLQTRATGHRGFAARPAQNSLPAKRRQA